MWMAKLIDITGKALSGEWGTDDETDITELEQKLKAAETVKDDSLSQELSVIKRYSGAEELTQTMVQELIEKIIVADPEHVEIVWKFKDEVRKFIGI